MSSAMTKADLIARAFAALDAGNRVTFNEDFIDPSYMDEYNRYVLRRSGKLYHVERDRRDNDANSATITTRDTHDRDGLAAWLGRFAESILAQAFVRRLDGQYIELPAFQQT